MFCRKLRTSLYSTVKMIISIKTRYNGEQEKKTWNLMAKRKWEWKMGVEKNGEKKLCVCVDSHLAHSACIIIILNKLKKIRERKNSRRLLWVLLVGWNVVSGKCFAFQFLCMLGAYIIKQLTIFLFITIETKIRHEIGRHHKTHRWKVQNENRLNMLKGIEFKLESIQQISFSLTLILNIVTFELLDLWTATNVRGISDKYSREISDDISMDSKENGRSTLWLTIWTGAPIRITFFLHKNIRTHILAHRVHILIHDTFSVFGWLLFSLANEISLFFY